MGKVVWNQTAFSYDCVSYCAEQKEEEEGQ